MAPPSTGVFRRDGASDLPEPGAARRTRRSVRPDRPPREGHDRPRTDEHLYGPDDPVLGAYLESGHNYGIACKGDLAVIDADEPEVLQEPRAELDETASQVPGSRTSEHDFLYVPGLEEDIPLYHPETDANVGHIKAAPQSYVVGPGSIHPSGNQYGPLEDDTIATVEEAELREMFEPFIRESTRTLPHESEHDAPSGVTRRGAASGDNVDLSVFDVVSSGRYPEGARREHPFHGSDTGANFMIDDRGETFRCWRHDCTGKALHLVGIEQGIIDCGEWLPGGLDSETWREIFAAAGEAGYDLPEFNPRAAAEPVAILPGTPKARARTWDWRNTGEDADGVFLVVELRMTNVGDESLDLTTNVFRAVDSEAREFETDSDAMIYPENAIVFEQLDPGLEKQGVVVFDVAPGDEYRLRIDPAGLLSTAESQYVELGTVEE